MKTDAEYAQSVGYMAVILKHISFSMGIIGMRYARNITCLIKRLCFILMIVRRLPIGLMPISLVVAT
jgi:hypothetical protein